MSRFIENALGWWVGCCERRPRVILSVLLMSTALIAGFVYQNFAIDSDLNKLIRPSGAPDWYQADEFYKKNFPESQQTSVVVVSGHDPGAVDRVAGRLAETFRASGKFEFVFAPALAPFLRDHRTYFLDRSQLDDWITGVQFDYGAILRLADGADLTNAALTLADQIEATDGLRLPSALASLAANFEDRTPAQLSLEIYPHLVPDQTDHYVIIIIKGQQTLDESLPHTAQMRLIRDLLDEAARDGAMGPGFGMEDEIRVRLTGEVPLSHEEMGAALDGIGIAGTISLILLAVILHFGVRSWRIIAATFSLLGVGVIWTLGFAVVAVGTFNTLALIFVVMFFGLGVDFAVHYSLRLWESTGPQSDDDPEVHAVREIGPALLLCMLTTSIAFLSFVPTDYRGLGELGIISAGGMVIAFVLTVTLLPTFFSLFGMPPALPSPRRFGARLAGLKPGLVLTVTCLIGLAAAWTAKDLRFDYSVLALRDENTEAMSTLLELQKNQIATDYSINVLAPDAAAAARLKRQIAVLPEVGEVLVPEDLVPTEQHLKHESLRALQTLLDTIGSVQTTDDIQSAEGLADAIEYLREVRGEVRREDLELFDGFLSGLESLGGDREQLARLNGQLREELTRELQELRVLTAAQPFSLDELPADLRARMISPDGHHLVTVMPAAPIASRAATDAFVAAVMDITPDLAGRAVVEWGVGDIAVRSFIEAVTVSISAIGILLIVYFRGVVLPVVVLVPLALTTLVTFAFIEISGLTLNMANILVIPLIFGLGVDTGIHVVHRFTVTGNLSAVLSSSTSRAVVISALTTIGTFFSLSFSPHKGAASVGLLLTIAITVMLLSTFVVLPALLSLIRR